MEFPVLGESNQIVSLGADRTVSDWKYKYILALAKTGEKGRPLSVAKDQTNLDTEVKILNVQRIMMNAIMATRKFVACLLLVAR